MKVFNYVIELNLRARQPWSHFRIHRHRNLMYSHLVFGKLSVVWGQPHLAEVEVHSGCGGLVHGIGEDYISYCEDCETIVEGATKLITMEEYENGL